MKVIVQVNAATHAKLMRLVDEPVEYGGALKIDENKQLIIERFHTISKYDEVPIPPGFVQFHTHPRACDFKLKKCTLSIPSGADLVGFAKAFANGDTIAHLIYTRDGVYIIMLDGMCSQRVRTDPIFRDHMLRGATRIFTEAIRQVRQNPGDYDIESWIVLANDSGFNIQWILPHEIPKFYLSKVK